MPSIIYTRGTSSIYSSPNMDRICDRIIQLNGDTLPGTFFSLSSGNYAQNSDCLLTIKGATINQRIIIVVDKMDIDCSGDKLLIYDGKKDQQLLLNKNEASQCGTKKSYYRTIQSNTAVIEFISNSDEKTGYGFIINVAINFPVKTCSQLDNLYRCRNYYCISNIFNCDDRNWCGDDSQRYLCR
ncbi:unnamed protein product [Adineta steineri]|uniref:CUB domain-containing protein n=1 Tax=Adineta steineri TaxID=433720 RepID=A0A815YUD5_9BILA|nr:unnamed protein product [Adineta steineri]CAF1337308.1 unnamed protein product [Adineta steineri]CAF1574755.1 unnamed protein product [Adineta steineri]CAF1591658.1 unnamed protein product [Adineta steineri]